MMLTETSVDGQPINREIWLENTIDAIRRLRDEGIPMLGLIWWPLLDQMDWDGAMTHRIGKIHQVGLFSLHRQPDGALQRRATPLVQQFKDAAAAGEARIGKLTFVAASDRGRYHAGPPCHQRRVGRRGHQQRLGRRRQRAGTRLPSNGAKGNGANGNGRTNGQGFGEESSDVTDSAGNSAVAEMAGSRLSDPAAGLSSQVTAGQSDLSTESPASVAIEEHRTTDRYGIVVFSHLRWGFVWQRPQQFLSRFAKKHPILFIEEPFFDRAEGAEPELMFHNVMPNVTVVCPHCPGSWAGRKDMPKVLLAWAKEAVSAMNENGEFDRPILWYYSPMDSAWSLGHFENRGIVYDSMDELSQFTGARARLIDNERRLMHYADIVFTGGYELYLKKTKMHPNVHFFGCGVEFSHFHKAQEPGTAIPPDIDFMRRPILGWFGVVDERVDYQMVGEMARLRPEWSFAMVGPVVKVDPNLLPVFPNLYWLGGRDYQVLPNYCRAFDVNMMCFAINAATEFINPTKALEYMATGKPIISTPVKDVIRQYSDLVEIARTAEEFVLTAERLMQHPDKEKIARGVEKAKRSSWEGTVATMQGLIGEAVSPSDRRSRQKISAFTEVELEYQFLPTQGS